MSKLDWEKANKKVRFLDRFDKSWLIPNETGQDIKDTPLESPKKQNKKANEVNPEEYQNDMSRHARRRASQKKYKQKKKAEAIKRKDTPKDRRQSFEAGKEQERQRIIQIIEKRKAYDCTCSCDCHSDTSPCTACKADNELIEIIKGEEK